MLDTFSVYSKVMDALDSIDPLSLVRLGDGEGRIIGFPEVVNRKQLDKHLRFWFGRKDIPSEDIKYIIRKNLIDAIENADILGHQPELKHPNTYWNIASKYAEYAGRMFDIDLCSINIHSHLWTRGYVSDVINRAARNGSVVLITCRDILSEIRQAYPKVDFVWLPIPEEGLTGKHPTNHYPRRYQSLMEIIGTVKKDRCNLYLIGAGVLGKIYCNRAKETGNIALDLGCLFDGWSGVMSRSFYKNNLDKYKLSRYA